MKRINDRVIHQDLPFQYKVMPSNANAFTISFQNGPLKVNGENGCQIEDLIEICMHRLDSFQHIKGAGKTAKGMAMLRNDAILSCKENESAMHYLEMALSHLNERTKRREDRGVEETMKP